MGRNMWQSLLVTSLYLEMVDLRARTLVPRERRKEGTPFGAICEISF